MPQIDLSAWRENVVVGCQIGGRQIGVGQSAFPSPCTSCICTNEGVSTHLAFDLIIIKIGRNFHSHVNRLWGGRNFK